MARRRSELTKKETCKLRRPRLYTVIQKRKDRESSHRAPDEVPRLTSVRPRRLRLFPRAELPLLGRAAVPAPGLTGTDAADATDVTDAADDAEGGETADDTEDAEDASAEGDRDATDDTSASDEAAGGDVEVETASAPVSATSLNVGNAGAAESGDREVCGLTLGDVKEAEAAEDCVRAASAAALTFSRGHARSRRCSSYKQSA